jgi:membrane dipeptidase
MIRLIDLHNDAITTLSPKRFLKYVARAERFGVRAILVSVWTTEIPDPLHRIREVRQFINGINSDVNLLLHIEDAWFVNEGNIDELIALRPFSVGLTWNAGNNLAGGALSSGTLTPLGVSAIRKLTSAGIRIDLAHLNRQSFFKVAAESGAPLFCSHTCFDQVCPHPRNLDRKQIQAIVDSDGVIGMTLAGKFLRAEGRAGMRDVYRHIKFFIDNFGDCNLCIGTDFHGTRNLPRGLRDYRDFRRFRKFLLRQGLSELCISKIFYLNSYKLL